MKNKTFMASVICALRGIGYAVKTEKNFKFYLLIYLLFFGINIVVGVDFIYYVLQAICTFCVFSAESLNTAIEHLVDMVDKEIKEEIKIIKDVAAGGVLFAGFAFFIVEFIGIGMSIWG